MWENISNSSILFSLNFYNQKESKFYNNTIFINKVYNYYLNQGYLNIILTQIVNILVSSFLFFYLIFLINCVNFKELIVLNNINYIINIVII